MPIHLDPLPLSVASNDAGGEWIAPPAFGLPTSPNMIINNDVDKSIVNIFVFGAFAGKNSGIIRSAKQDDNYGASNIILPCPSS